MPGWLGDHFYHATLC